MNHRGIKNILLIGFISLYIVIYKFLIFPKFMGYSEIITASFFIVLFAVSVFFLGYRKCKMDIDTKYFIRTVLLFVFLAFFGMYGMGFITGFLRNSYSRQFLVLLDNIFAPIILIIFEELFRYVVIWANKDRKKTICFFTIALIVFECAIAVRVIPFGDVSEFFRVFTLSLFPITLKNIVLSYLCYHTGFRAPLIYRLIMDVYLFIVPFVPDIGDYLNSVILIALPVLIYINTSSYVESSNHTNQYVFEQNRFTVWDIPGLVLIATLIILVSGLFPHYLIGVGSNSMQPAISKGDAVLLRKVSSKTEIKQDDIIAYFNKDDKTVIHRVQEVTTANGKKVYVTKGDANNSADSNVVYFEQIKGVVLFKIPYIAYPTVWFSEYINERR